MVDFSILINKQLDDIVQNAVGESEEGFRKFAKEIYGEIVSRSPRITGYYVTNHRVDIRSSGGQFKSGGSIRLFPSSKDSEEQGFYFANLESAIAEAEAKIDELELGDILIITTIVPYADAVEAKHNVYTIAQAMVGLS